VGKVDSSGTSTYKRDGADVTDPVLSDGSALYTPGVSERRGSTTKFDHQDYLGTMTRQTNSSQSTTATRTYDAFGMLVASTGTPQGPFGFAGGCGYQEDVDSGLKLLGHRYYDPSTGRFLTRDPAKDGRNWYSYCENRSTTDIDPEGLQVPGITLTPWRPVKNGPTIDPLIILPWLIRQLTRHHAPPKPTAPPVIVYLPGGPPAGIPIPPGGTYHGPGPVPPHVDGPGYGPSTVTVGPDGSVTITPGAPIKVKK
jgi:RHS repeat-associated protein